MINIGYEKMSEVLLVQPMVLQNKEGVGGEKETLLQLMG